VSANPLAPAGHHPEPVVTIWADELDAVADLVGFIEDWLLHAQPETLADLDAFAAPGTGHAERVIAELGNTAVRFRHLAQKGTS
jgi:hypothetical protein